MEAKDTVMSAGELCRLVCQEHRSKTLEAKDCNGLDCELCQLTKQAEISFKAGIKEVVEWVKAHPRIQHSWDEWQSKLKDWGIDNG